MNKLSKLILMLPLALAPLAGQAALAAERRLYVSSRQHPHRNILVLD